MSEGLDQKQFPPLSEVAIVWILFLPFLYLFAYRLYAHRLELRFFPWSSQSLVFYWRGFFLHLHRESSHSVQYRSEEHTSELQSRGHLVCRLLLEKKNVIRMLSIVIC